MVPAILLNLPCSASELVKRDEGELDGDSEQRMGSLGGRKKLSSGEAGVQGIRNSLAGTLTLRRAAARCQLGVEVIFRG